MEGNTGSGSIIDRILSSKQAEAIEHLSPAETIAQLLRELATKEADVLRRRFGLNGQEQQTLEDIGKVYHVTRERIRQIERQTLLKLKQSKAFETQSSSVKAAVSQVLTSHGGYLEEQSLLGMVLQLAGETPENRQAMRFLLNELLSDQVAAIEATKSMKAGWRLRTASSEELTRFIATIIQVLKIRNSPVQLPALLSEVSVTDFGKTHPQLMDEDALVAAIDLSEDVGHNPFGEYGLNRWGRIHPRRMNDKIYLVLKRAGEPLHFQEIAKRINDIVFDDRKAYPPTVHNELILDSNYVLVGRGMYALKEWGYEPGVVADVIHSVLKKAGTPLPRPAIIEAVLKQRVVKRNTIHLALTNRQRFVKLPNGEYTIMPVTEITQQKNGSAEHIN